MALGQHGAQQRPPIASRPRRPGSPYFDSLRRSPPASPSLPSSLAFPIRSPEAGLRSNAPLSRGGGGPNPCLHAPAGGFPPPWPTGLRPYLGKRGSPLLHFPSPPLPRSKRNGPCRCSAPPGLIQGPRRRNRRCPCPPLAASAKPTADGGLRSDASAAGVGRPFRRLCGMPLRPCCTAARPAAGVLLRGSGGQRDQTPPNCPTVRPLIPRPRCSASGPVGAAHRRQPAKNAGLCPRPRPPGAPGSCTDSPLKLPVADPPVLPAPPGALHAFVLIPAKSAQRPTDHRPNPATDCQRNILRQVLPIPPSVWYYRATMKTPHWLLLVAEILRLIAAAIAGGMAGGML